MPSVCCLLFVVGVARGLGAATNYARDINPPIKKSLVGLEVKSR